jgi:hypothetical protein
MKMMTIDKTSEAETAALVLRPARREARDRHRTLRVVVSASERAAIAKRAKEASLSVSAYLRSAALGAQFRSNLDHAAVTELAKIAADQGRLGGLLKLWLVDQPGRGVPETNVRDLLEKLNDLQGTLAEIVARV